MLKIENLHCKIGNFYLKNINLEIRKTEYFVLLGPTGSGKTTLLKCILGLNKITSGKIFTDDKEITNFPPEKRNIGFLPQNYLLFPNMNVFENIAFGLKIKKKSDETKNEVIKIAKLLNIGTLLNRGINNLSGGEAQRVSLARALVIKPKVLLLDEPFSAIHEGLKSELWFELKNILKTLQIPTVHITHNLDEGYAVADKMGVIIDGKLAQQGYPNEIFSKPENSAVAGFLGLKNIFEGQIISQDGQKILLEYKGIKIIADSNIKKLEIGQKINPVRDGVSRRDISNKVKFCIRPDAIKVIKAGYLIREELKENLFDAQIISSYFFSDTCIMKLRILSGGEHPVFSARFPSLIYKRYNLSDGLKIKIAFWKEGIIMLTK
ncbi:MAG: ABC transporter ATP-binding protein [Elusimicrobia bacterium]|nr:ABC transporter ATP-binding protein [Elusimicrobiota bacterium]